MLNIRVATTADINILWNAPLDAATVTGSAFVLRDSGDLVVPATVSYDSFGYRVVMTPDSDLAAGEVYRVTVAAAGVGGLRSLPMEADYVWSFTTRPEPALPPAGPAVSGTFPGNHSVNVPVNISPQLTWSEPMDPASLNSSNVGLISSWSKKWIASALSYDPATSTLTIDPTGDLGTALAYAVVLGEGITTASGAPAELGGSKPLAFWTVREGFDPAAVGPAYDAGGEGGPWGGGPDLGEPDLPPPGDPPLPPRGC